MKKLVILLFISIVTACPLIAAEMKYGSLNIFSKVPSAKIYVDGSYKGTGNAQIKEVQAGTHFVKVVNEDATPEVVLFADIADVEPGEVTTLMIDERGAQTQHDRQQKEEVDVFKTKRILDYSREMHMGWFVKLGYMTNLYYSFESPTLDNYAATFGLGIGFKIPIAPNIDFSLEMEKSSFSSPTSTWTFMPITANLQLSYLPSPYFRGKQYYGLGIGYYITDLESSLKQNLTTLGYHLFYGLEMPAGDKNAYFIEFGYHMADLSRYSYTLNSAYVAMGYRWDVAE